MHKFGVIMIWVGLLMSILGLFFGFIDLVNEGEASIWIAIIPVGFASMLTGITITQFSKK